jgi:putative oxidoreductase
MIWITRFLFAAPLLMLGICFAQSSYDQCRNYKGNLGWLKEHFASSPLAGTVPILLPLLTVLELLAGLLGSIAPGFWIAEGIGGDFTPPLISLALFFCMASLLALITGQRLAKDYAGAVSLATYMVLAVLSLALFYWDLMEQFTL